MAELRGGTTIAGFPALHSGMPLAYLGGNLTINGNVTLPSNGITLSTLGTNALRMQTQYGWVDVGSQESTGAHIYTDRAVFKVNKDIQVNGSTVWHAGNLTPLRATDSYVSTDTAGNTTYPRIFASNSGAADANWFRVPSTGGGILPYANGVSNMGSSSWRFASMHAVNFYEDGTALSSKYATAAHNHNTLYSTLNGTNVMTGNNQFSSTNATGNYSSSGIELRETNRVGSTQSTPAYAPAIAWHWSGRVQAQLALESTGILTLRDGATHTTLKTMNAGDLQVNGNSVWHAGNFTPALYASVDRTIMTNLATVSSGGYDIKIGRAPFWNGAASGGDSLHSSNWLHIGAESNLALWSAAGNMQFRQGPTGSAKIQMELLSDGKLALNSGGATLALTAGGSNHTYMEFYARGLANTTRSGYLGYGGIGSNAFNITNQIGEIVMTAPFVNITGSLSFGTSFVNGVGQMYWNGSNFRASYGNASTDWESLYSTKNIRWGTATPSGGSDGDIYIQY